jgi:hypothetical protein
MTDKRRIKMNEKIFNTCLEFHQELIRADLSDVTISNAKKILVDGDDRLPGIGAQSRSRAKAFAETLTVRFDTLKAYHGADWATRSDLYKSDYTRVPAIGVFIAVEMVIVNGLKIGTAAVASGVNFQCVKVLKPRVERYINYAKKINELMV